MKRHLVSSLIIICIGTAAFADDLADAPFIAKRIKQLTTAVQDDVKSGKLTKEDGDQLTRAITHVQATVKRQPTLTPKTRADLRNQLSEIQTALDRKEAASKAAASASPSTSPAPTP